MTIDEKFRVARRLLNVPTGGTVFCLCWLKLTEAIAMPWIMVLAPVICVGSLHLLLDLLIFIYALWSVGCHYVARSDQAARRGHTIRTIRRGAP